MHIPAFLDSHFLELVYYFQSEFFRVLCTTSKYSNVRSDSVNKTSDHQTHGMVKIENDKYKTFQKR